MLLDDDRRDPCTCSSSSYKSSSSPDSCHLLHRRANTADAEVTLNLWIESVEELLCIIVVPIICHALQYPNIPSILKLFDRILWCHLGSPDVLDCRLGSGSSSSKLRRGMETRILRSGLPDYPNGAQRGSRDLLWVADFLYCDLEDILSDEIVERLSGVGPGVFDNLCDVAFLPITSDRMSLAICVEAGYGLTVMPELRWKGRGGEQRGKVMKSQEIKRL